MNFDQLLRFGVDQGATAIHLQAGAPPQLRIGGLIRGVNGPALGGDELETFLTSIAPQGSHAETPLGSTFSAATTVGRFRCTTYTHIGGPGVVLNVIPAAIRSVEDLHLPRVVRDVALSGRGLVLVVGPSGSGKTSTLAAMVDLINGASAQKIVTVEDPVEYLHANKKAHVTQMEVGRNCTSFEQGLELAMRQDADVIIVGDLRDAGSARLALGAAEAGRRVLTAMSGLAPISALTRLLALVPPSERDAATMQLAGALEAVIVQRFANTRDGKLQPVVEVLRGGLMTARAIQEHNFKDLGFFIEGRQSGMQSFDQHLLELHHAGTISGTEAMRLATNPETVGAGLRTIRQAAAASTRTTASTESAAEIGLAP
jgi:twitching motility protein PilT